MRQLTCPSCRDDLAIVDHRAGRFRIACPRCAASLLVSVPPDPAGKVDVAVEAAPAPAPVLAANLPTGTERSAGDMVRSGWLGRYRVVAPDRGRAGGIGPIVALKRMRDQGRTDPRFVAAWTLEALAAAELRHPNLAAPIGVEVTGDQVYAIGPAEESRSLDDPGARADLDRQARVAVVLHAARGLRFAHEQGVFGRDLGLGSIQRSANGLVTVTGFGVHLAPTGVTPAAGAVLPTVETGSASGAGAAPGVAPAPSPQLAQARDVAELGRILATLVAGVSGDRAVPPGLATMIRRLTGEEAGSNLVDSGGSLRELGAVVRALETELGVSGPLLPPESEAQVFAAAVAEFSQAPLAPLRKWVAHGFGSLLGLIVFILLAVGRIGPALGWLTLGGLIAATITGWRIWQARYHIGGRLAVILAVVERRDAVTIGVAGLIGIMLLAATQSLGFAVLVVASALGLGSAWHFGLDRPLAASRALALVQLRSLLLGWRRQGSAEEAIERYVASAGGSCWEEVFAALFGFDAVAPARARWGTNLAGGRRPRFAPVRAWWLARLDQFVQRRSDERTRGWLDPILERDYEARGTHILTARRRSQRAAEAVIGVLRQYRRAADGSVGIPLAEALRQAVARPEDFLASPEIADAVAREPWWAAVGSTLIAVLGRWFRCALGLACLAAAAVWMERNNLYSFDAVKDAVTTATVQGDRAGARFLIQQIGHRFTDQLSRFRAGKEQPEPLRLGVIPFALSEPLDGFNLTVAGLILLASSLIAGARIIPFAMSAALIPLTPGFVRAENHTLDLVSIAAMAIGCGIFALGFGVSRGRDQAP